MDVAVVGAGRVGTAVGVLLARSGHRVVAVSGGRATGDRVARYLPGVPLLPAPDAAADADLVAIAVPDDVIPSVAGEVATSVRSGTAVAHLSGAASLTTLDAAGDAGAEVLSVHPLQTVPDVEAGIGGIPGSAVAVTARTEDGYRVGEAVGRDLGGRPFRLADDRKPLYHAAAVFCSNYLVAVEAVAERLFDLAGVEEPLEALAPLARSSLDHALARGPLGALTGPAARGDAGTIRRNLEALEAAAPHAVPAYAVLAEAAVHLASAAGRVSEGAVATVEEVLARWR